MHPFRPFIPVTLTVIPAIFALAGTSLAQTVPSGLKRPLSPDSQAQSSAETVPAAWSVVYLPPIDWTAGETTQAVTLIRKLKPDVVVSLGPCPFAKQLADASVKPVFLDPSNRRKPGTAPKNPTVATHVDASSVHPVGKSTANVVWLALEPSNSLNIGPADDGSEAKALAMWRIRKHLAELTGEVIFLVDPSIPVSDENEWVLPHSTTDSRSATSAVNCFACLRPGELQDEIPETFGVSPRVPLIHWIHGGSSSVVWLVLPIDGGPAIDRSPSTVFRRNPNPGTTPMCMVPAPAKPNPVPAWMDDYINGNTSLQCGTSRRQRPNDRIYHWFEAGTPLTPGFPKLGDPGKPAPETKDETGKLPHDAVRSPSGDFALLPGQFDDIGSYPAEGDDGINVMLTDMRIGKTDALYFAGLHEAWPTAATWFTDRFVLTSGFGCTCDPVVSASDTWDASGISGRFLTPQLAAQTVRLFDFQTHRSYITHSLGNGPDRGTASFTERIAFPGNNLRDPSPWKALWNAVRSVYQAKPEDAPFTPGAVAETVKMPLEGTPQWRDLGIWPPPDTWELIDAGNTNPEIQHPSFRYMPVQMETEDPYLLRTEPIEGNTTYSIRIIGSHEGSRFMDSEKLADVVAKAPILTTGRGCLPRLDTIHRMGEDRRFLILAGTYQTPGGDASDRRIWILLTDLASHRTWSLHGESAP